MKRSPSNQGSTVDALFISPHLDDAVLSASLTIRALVAKNKLVSVITLFSCGSEHRNPAIASFLQQSNATSGTSLFHQRKIEDARALATLGIKHVTHLLFVDALFRSVNGRLLYPTFDNLFSGRVVREDNYTKAEVLQALLSLRQNMTKNRVPIYTCLGVGNHVDHVMTYETVTSVFGNHPIFFWEDVPYRNIPEWLFGRLAAVSTPLKRIAVEIPKESGRKERAVRCYRSQLTGLVQNGLNRLDYIHEVLYER